MQLKELFESKSTNILKQLQRDCAPYIDQNPFYLPLYRGMVLDNEKTITKMQVNKQRSPTMSSMFYHEEYNKYFLKHFNKPYRSCSVFSTGNKFQAKEYGDPFVIYPIGKFDFCWSPHMEDLFLLEDDYTRLEIYTNQHNIVPDDNNGYPAAVIKQFISDTLDGLQYRENDNLHAAISSDNEIMVNCDYYYAIPYTVFSTIVSV